MVLQQVGVVGVEVVQRMLDVVELGEFVLWVDTAEPPISNAQARVQAPSYV